MSSISILKSRSKSVKTKELYVRLLKKLYIPKWKRINVIL